MPAYRRYNAAAELKPRKPPISRRTSSLGYDAAFVTQHPLLTIGAVLCLAVLAVPVLLAHHAADRLSLFPNAIMAQAWASADPVRESSRGLPPPDAQIKQAWVFGDRMRALGKDAIVDAAAVQTRLVPPPFDSAEHVNSSQAEPFGFAVHSLLPTLNCSDECLLSDDSVLEAVNRAVHDQRSPARIALRPESVLGSPAFRSGRVKGADAIVINLLLGAGDSGTSARQAWDRNAASLASDAGHWDVRTGPKTPAHTSGGELVRVMYRASDFVDDMVFCTLYVVAGAYLAWSIGRAAGLRSRAAQLFAVAAEVAISVTVALSAASVIGIDASNIPWKMYPLAVVPQCLKNSIHLLHELENTGAQPSPRRISTAYKRMGTAPFFAAIRVIIVFAFLSVDAPSGLATFCHFTILALTIDLIVFMTFMGAVSSLNVRRLGLEESFSTPQGSTEKVDASAKTGAGQPYSRGRSLYPEAVANIMSLVCAVFLVFRFREGVRMPTLKGLQMLLRSVSAKLQLFGGKHAASSLPSTGPDTLRWLKAQDTSTLGEIMRLLKPGSSNIIVQTFDPLIVIPKLAKRNTTISDDLANSVMVDTLSQRGIWLPTLLLCAGIMLSLLVWNALLSGESDSSGSAGETSDISSVRCLPPAHTLDIFLLASGARRFLVSVGFDREVRLWDLESATPSNQLIPWSPSQGVSWPVTTVSIDNRAEWVAICSQGGNVSLWNRQQERFGLSTSVNGRIVTCTFARVPSRDRFHDMTTRLLLVLESGSLIDVNIETGDVSTAQICNTLVRSAHLGSSPRMPARLITISEHEGIFISTNREGWWSTRPLQLAALDFASPAVKQSMRFSVIPSLRGVGIAYNEEKSDLHLVDMFSGTLIYSLQPRSIRFPTLRAFHSPSQACVYCGSTAVASFSIAYTDRESGAFMMSTISAENNPRYRTGLICLRSERDARERRCMGFSSAAEVTHAMPDPGVWEATGANGVAGVRKREVVNGKGGGVGGLLGASFGAAGASSGSGLAGRRTALTRRRGCAPTATSSSSAGAGHGEERWEAWTMTAKGSISSHALTTSLLTSKSGPVCRLARNAVAVGLADMLVLVQFGAHLHDNDEEEGTTPKPTHHGRLSRQNSRIGRSGG